MKRNIKKVKVGIKSVKEVLADFVKTGEAIARIIHKLSFPHDFSGNLVLTVLTPYPR